MPKKSSIFKELTEIEKANIKKAKSRFSEKIRSYREGCNLLCELIHLITEKLNEKKVIELRDIAIASLCNRVVGTSKVIYELSIRGYEYDVMILNRSLYENFIALWYITEDNDNAEKWLFGKVKLGEMKKELNIQSKQDFGKTYGMLSDFVHSNIRGIGTLIDFDKEGSLSCVIEPRFDSVKSEDFLPSHWALPMVVLRHHYKELIEQSMSTKINKAMLEAEKLAKPDKNAKTKS